MVPPVPIAYATISSSLPSNPYILGIIPSPTAPHLILRHPSSSLTVTDNQSLQPIAELKGGHTGNVSSVCIDQEQIWSAAMDGTISRWDERSRQKANLIKAFIRKPLPVLSLTVSAFENLVIGGTEVVSAEAHILFWDPRNTSSPVYIHSSTHSDDITHLSLLRSSSSFLPPSHNADIITPHTLLLSASTDGLVALSNMKESDEEEAVVAEENWGQSIADAGGYMCKGRMRLWTRSDMDEMAIWSIGRSGLGEIELQDQTIYPSSEFKFKTFHLPQTGPNVARAAAEEMKSKAQIKSDYLINVVPSLGLSSQGGPMVAVGTNEGDIIVQHHKRETTIYLPSSYFLTGPDSTRGHKDVVRALYHDLSNEALYTGSEDGVLAGFSLASLPERLVVGDPDIDDDDDRNEEDEEMEEESEIETQGSDEDDDMVDEGPRHNPVVGVATRGRDTDKKKERRNKRFGPY
ncbi:uncharacterized protein L203_103003 [Cryptococcus depauperatus CBS 7841]|uniref:Uncharacterized protein n=1 Tax=Cryptococcus depauperatus CBS 7841 TaxID=1295531 RepID=A0A1E3IRT5_9TREE|nr:hypothetical protein L203_01727 [Cryptococcus depauperatus CBS 7841]